MAESDIADELFLPLENGAWSDTRFRLVRSERSQARTRITGVRFLAADPKGQNLEPERAVQNDFHRLLDSVAKVREDPSYANLRLSNETFRTSPRRQAPRLRFGLACDDEARDQSEDRAAKLSYRAIRRAIRRAGFVVVTPEQGFDPATGFTGLQAWTDSLRLRKRRLFWLWLLLLPLLLLLPDCDPAAEFFGAPIATNSVVIIVDRSGSMGEHFDALHQEARRLLASLADAGSMSMDVIAFDSDAESCLGAITALDEPTQQRIDAFLGALNTGGGTNLASGLELAAEEIAKHGEPTTLIILTDAEDSSIGPMLAGHEELLAKFRDIEIRGFGLTPRLFGPPGPEAVSPDSNAEQQLSELSELLGGHFGPTAPSR